MEKVWQALVDPKIIEKWSGINSKMSGEVGEKFELWGGDIHGTNTEVIENKKLVQDWYGGKWDNSSKVTFLLIGKNSETHVELIHKDIPDNEADDIEDGWKRYYLGEIKKLLEK